MHSRRFGGWLALLMLIVIHSDFLHDLNNQRVEVCRAQGQRFGPRNVHRRCWREGLQPFGYAHCYQCKRTGLSFSCRNWVVNNFSRLRHKTVAVLPPFHEMNCSSTARVLMYGSCFVVRMGREVRGSGLPGSGHVRRPFSFWRKEEATAASATAVRPARAPKPIQILSMR